MKPREAHSPEGVCCWQMKAIIHSIVLFIGPASHCERPVLSWKHMSYQGLAVVNRLMSYHVGKQPGSPHGRLPKLHLSVLPQ